MVTRRLVFVLVIALAVLLAARVPLASGQDPQAVRVEFTAYEGNPVLERGSDAWDAQSIHDPSVVFYDGLYYMFYGGDHQGWTGAAIGYATSSDGLVWEKYPGNPVLEADGTGFDSTAIVNAHVTVEGDTWVLYYLGQVSYGFMPTSGIGRATAPSPSGPWTREEDPVLTPGSTGEWDNGGVSVTSVIATNEGYTMYYMGGPLLSLRDVGIGMATSPDGITWAKYDDPTTTEPPYAESDPVLQSSHEGWDSVSILGGGVLRTADGWEMFYSGKGKLEGETQIAARIGYATSDDGIHWTKYEGNPILTAEDDPAEPAYAHNDLHIASLMVRGSSYFLYYDYLWQFGGGVGVATGTVTRE
jgi:predicted GH43/DUF377 family glycosyl hydrolase